MNRLLKAGLAALTAAGMTIGSATAAQADPLTDAGNTVAATLEDGAYTLAEAAYAVAETLEDGAYTVAGLMMGIADLLEEAAYALVDAVETGYETVKPVLDTVGPVCVRQTLPSQLGGGTVQVGYCPSE